MDMIGMKFSVFSKYGLINMTLSSHEMNLGREKKKKLEEK